jgi:hypothetical protein
LAVDFKYYMYSNNSREEANGLIASSALNKHHLVLSLADELAFSCPCPVPLDPSTCSLLLVHQVNAYMFALPCPVDS